MKSRIYILMIDQLQSVEESNKTQRIRQIQIELSRTSDHRAIYFGIQFEGNPDPVIEFALSPDDFHNFSELIYRLDNVI